MYILELEVFQVACCLEPARTEPDQDAQSQSTSRTRWWSIRSINAQRLFDPGACGL